MSLRSLHSTNRNNYAVKGQGETYAQEAPGHVKNSQTSCPTSWTGWCNSACRSCRRRRGWNGRVGRWKKAEGGKLIKLGEQRIEKTNQNIADVYGAIDNLDKKDRERAKQAHEKFKAQQLADATAAALAISTQGASASATALSAAEGDLKAFPEQASKGNCPGC